MFIRDFDLDRAHVNSEHARPVFGCTLCTPQRAVREDNRAVLRAVELELRALLEMQSPVAEAVYDNVLELLERL